MAALEGTCWSREKGRAWPPEAVLLFPSRVSTQEAAAGTSRQSAAPECQPANEGP